MPLKDNILPDASRPPTMDMIVRARDMYREKFSVSRILAMCDISYGTLYFWLDGGPRDETGKPMLEPVPRRRQVVGKRKPPLTSDRASLGARLLRTAERQAREIELRLAQPSGATPERERDVRMLAMLVRSLRELTAMQSAAEAAERAAAAEPDPDAKARRERMWREVEDHAATLRIMTRHLRDLGHVEKMEAARATAEAKAKEEAATTDKMRDDLRSKMLALIASREAAEQAAEQAAQTAQTAHEWGEAG